ncbi:MAG: ACT domain-containing protein [Acidimicrobiales bacterium]
MSCPDQPGIVAAVAAFVAGHGGNVVDLQQHTDDTDGAFFQRAEFDLQDFDIDRSRIADAFTPVAERFAMRWSLRFTDERPRPGLLASREPHCLQDLLSLRRAGEPPVDVSVVVSNHPVHGETAAWFGVEVPPLPVVDDGRE